MSALPPPAATLARVAGTARLAAASNRAPLHILAGGLELVTRCGRRVGPVSWATYGPSAPAPARRLCARCHAALPAATRRNLIPTPAEARAVHELTAREATQALIDVLAELRTVALVDGSAYEPTVLVEARPAPPPTVPLRRVDRDQLVSGYVATPRPLSLLDLLNTFDPSRPHVPQQRMFVLDAPTAGSAVDVGGSYDARAYDWRRKGRAR